MIPKSELDFLSLNGEIGITIEQWAVIQDAYISKIDPRRTCYWNYAPSQGYDLLKSWRTVPGLKEDNNVDRQELLDWIGNSLQTLALTWVASIAGLSAKTIEGASAFSYPLIFLPFIYRFDTGSCPCLCQNQPVGNDIWVALTWCVRILLVAYIFAVLLTNGMQLNTCMCCSD